MFSRLSSIELSMSIYLAARLQKRRARKAIFKKSIAALLSFSVTSCAALFVFATDPKNELVIDPSAPRLVVEKTATVALSYDQLLNQNIFKGPNRAAKVDRPRYPSALQIASAFKTTRVAMLQSKNTTPSLGTGTDRIAVASIDPSITPKMAPSAAVGFAQQPMPKVAALEAIEALGDIPDAGVAPRDPNLPFPVDIPTKLAYARDAAPKTEVFTQTLTQASMNANKKQHWCLATAIYFEARGESYRGQVAVAQVVRNRVKHGAYPSTICGVVFQNQTWRNRCQFSFACDGIPERVNEKAAWRQAEEIATKVINGDIYLPEVSNATHYHANYVWPKWAPKLKKLTKIGTHIFYRFKKS